MGIDPDREPPFFFTKPADALVENGAVVAYPSQTMNFHYEGELVVAVGTGGRNIDEKDSLNHVWGYACGNDLTRRDIQASARDSGRPWDMSKGFDRSAVCGPIHQVTEVVHIATGNLKTLVNGQVKQNTDLANMTWSVPEIIAYLSQFVELCAGDLIFSGTPEGVGPLVAGDTCQVSIEGLGEIETTISEKVG